MNRLIEKTVSSGLVTACRLATCPTSRSPPLVKPTTEGVMRLPSGLVMTTGSPPSITATTELVVELGGAPRCGVGVILAGPPPPAALAAASFGVRPPHGAPQNPPFGRH